MRRGPSNEGWSSLVERDSERELIGEALRSSKLGRGCFVILYGPAGIGRSSLLRAAVPAADRRGMAVVEACGSELERGYGFGVVRQLLEAPITSLTVAEPRSLLRDAGPAAESALGIAHSDQSSSAFEEIEAVYRVIVRLAAIKPLLVAVDDLQWCDRPSLDFLCFLGHRTTRLPVTILAAWRRGEPGVRAGRLQALAGKPDTLFLTLGPLSHDGVRAAIEHEFGGAADNEAVSVVHERTGGQPRLVAELLAALRLRNIAPKAGCREAIEAVTPESVRRDLVARLGRHPETVRRVAEVVAVLENGSIAQVAALADIDQDRARAAAASLGRAGLLRDDAIVAYTHPLLRAAVYDTLSSLSRTDLHRRAATVLCEDADGTNRTVQNRVAEHLLRSEPAGDPRFAQVLLEQARLAVGLGAIVEAERYLKRALRETEDSSSRGEVLVELSELELRTGDLASAGAHASEGLGLASTPDRRVSLSLVSAQVAAATTGWAGAVELLESETGCIGDGEPESEPAIEAAAAVLRACGNTPPSGSSETTEAIESLAGTTSAERATLSAYATQMTLSGGGSAACVRDLCARALRDHGEPLISGISEVAEYLACRTAIFADGSELVELALANRGAEGTPPRHGRELSRRALSSQLACARGDLVGAATEAHAALGLLDGQRTLLDREIHSDLLAGLVAIRIGRAAYEDAAKALAQLTEGGDAPTVVAGSLRIALALAQSAPAEAIACASELEPEPVGIAAPNVSWRAWAALAYHAADNHERALALASAHLEQARAWGACSSLGRALVIRGVVGPGRRRLELLEEAVAVLEETPARLELAWACIELGVALRRARRRHDARAQLVRGADLAHRCGAASLSARARAELVAAGARPRRDAFSGMASLTISELRVARLAATGMTNREIAQQLVVSVKTISGQLTSIYRKLDVHDRGALAAVIQRDQTSAELDLEGVG